MKKTVALAAVVCLGVSCASLPAPRQIQSSWRIDKPFDQVWQGTLETLAEMDFKLAMPLDKSSGLISTELMNIPENRKEWWDAGKLAITQFKQGYRGKITVFVKAIGDAQSELKIISKFEVLFTDSMQTALTKSRMEQAIQGEDLFARSCVSTGKLEAEIFRLVSEKMK
jgi:uncharacterized lipoprotein